MGIESEAEGMQRRILVPVSGYEKVQSGYLVPVSVSAKMQSGNLVLGSGLKKCRVRREGWARTLHLINEGLLSLEKAYRKGGLQ